jgi:osmotically-inducible protein OsmY
MKQRSNARLLLLGAALMTTTVFANTSSDSPITVTEQRIALDKRIQAEVINVIARNPELSGRVSVETRDQVVNLSGYLTTRGQVRRAGLEAGRVQGVKFVVNEIRPQLGVVNN